MTNYELYPPSKLILTEEGLKKSQLLFKKWFDGKISLLCQALQANYLEQAPSKDAVGRYLQRRSDSHRGISYDHFKRIRDTLWQKAQPAPEWREIATPVTEKDSSFEVIRKNVSDMIRARCGRMKVLDMPLPITLGAIFVKVMMWQSPLHRQDKTAYDIGKELTEEQFLRRTRKATECALLEGMEAAKEYPFLMVYGKPGAGKTTFLKWLMMQCLEGTLHPQCAPIFVSLREFAKDNENPSLTRYIQKEYGLLDQSEGTQNLFRNGSFFVCCDGLDEIHTTNRPWIIDEIDHFAKQNPRCSIVVSSRIAATEARFEGAVDIEVADFNAAQIKELQSYGLAPKDVQIEPRTL